MFKNRNLLIIALIVIVNALGYGIIIPVLYSYSVKFGLSDFQNGLLFAVYSICQFISTPIIGRLSDKYGRRPLLITSITGTALSLFMMAFAPNAWFLFFARALDGITAGNIPVASAVIADTTSEKDRAKGYGVIGASYGFGFIFGPAIAAVTVGISDTIPFVIAGVVTLTAAILTALFLPETNTHMGEIRKGKLFDFRKMASALVDPNVGYTLLITLLYATAFAMFIYAFQPYAIKVLQLSTNQISLLFTGFGVLGLLSQILVLPNAIRIFGLKRGFSLLTAAVSLSFAVLFFTRTPTSFILASILLGLTNSTINPMVQTILSDETDAKSQGTMQGLNASYMSLGQIAGPIIGGAVATYSVPAPFLGASFMAFLCFLLSFHVMRRGSRKESAF